MTPEDQALHDLLLAYARFSSSADGKLILSDLVTFTKQSSDAVVRAGRADVLLRLLCGLKERST